MENTNSSEQNVNPEPSRKGKGGRPRKQITLEKRQTVKEMAKLGITQSRIGKVVGFCPRTLRERFRQELFDGALDADTAVLKTLHELATDHKHVAATIFWSKVRCGYKHAGLVTEDDVKASQDPPKSPSSPRPEKKSEFPPMDDTKILEFNVYCNDGEPNAEY